MGLRFFFILLVAAISAQAQDKEFKLCKYSYFGKKQGVSTSECFDEAGRWGKAKVYDMSGKVIYERELRKFAGHSSVSFTYYDNGAVKKAYWSSAPDGGIQWYRSTTYFAQDGKITEETNDSYDDGPGTFLKRPDQIKPQKPEPVVKVAECAVIYSSEMWFTNTTRFAVEITVTRKFQASEQYKAILKPSESVKCGQMINAEHFDEPEKYYDFSVKPVKANNKQRLIVIPAEKKPENIKKEVRRYYYEVRRIV